MAVALEVPALTTELVCVPVDVRADGGAVVVPTAMPLQLARPHRGCTAVRLVHRLVGDQDDRAYVAGR